MLRGIPEFRLSETERIVLLKIGQNLHERIVGGTPNTISGQPSVQWHPGREPLQNDNSEKLYYSYNST